MKLVISAGLLLVTLLVFNNSSPTEAGDLRADLREFWNLLPKRRIGVIAARRYIGDVQFRAAMDYVRSAEFRREWRRLVKAPAVMAVIAYVRPLYDVAGVIDKIPNQLRQLQVPRNVAAPTALPVHSQRNLSTFLREAVSALPRSQIASLMSRKVREGGDFAALYKALRDPEFRQLVDTAKKTPRLWDELQRHYINVNDVANTVFEVLRWGP